MQASTSSCPSEPDLVSVLKITNDTLPNSDVYNEVLIQKVEEAKQNLDLQEEFEKLVFSSPEDIDIDTLKKRFDKELPDIDTVQKQAIARQIVYYLNIIYLFSSKRARSFILRGLPPTVPIATTLFFGMPSKQYQYVSEVPQRTLLITSRPHITPNQ